MKSYLEPEEINRLEQVASNLRDMLLIHLLFYLGCRISEALALKVEDIDFTRGTVTIIHLKSSLRLSCLTCGTRLGRSHTFCPKCGSKIEETQVEQQQHRRQRLLPVDEVTLKMLREYISRGGPITRERKTYILDITRFRAWQIIRDCARRASLPSLVNPETGKTHNVSPHRLRDAFAVHAMKLNDSGDGMRFLQGHLGHQSFNTTAKYRKVAGEEHRKWYDKLWSEDKP